jgi:hypothetical protein
MLPLPQPSRTLPQMLRIVFERMDMVVNYCGCKRSSSQCSEVTMCMCMFNLLAVQSIPISHYCTPRLLHTSQSQSQSRKQVRKHFRLTTTNYYHSQYYYGYYDSTFSECTLQHVRSFSVFVYISIC